MKITELFDISDLPTTQPVLIYGAGVVGDKVTRLLGAFENFPLKGYLDAFKTGSVNGFPISKAEEIEDLSQYTLVITCMEEDAVASLLGELGVNYLYKISPDLFIEIEQQKNFVHLPNALSSEDLSSDVPSQDISRKPLNPDEAQIRGAGARLLLKKGHLEVGFQKLRQLALEYGYIHVEDDVAGCAFRDSNDQVSLIRFWDEAVKQGILPCQAEQKKQNASKEKALPSLFINTMLKSGTGFLTRVLTEEMGYAQFFTTLRGSPNDWILPNYLNKFAEGGAISVQHMDAASANLDALEKAGVKKIYVHMRDPRQATVSYLHHLENNLVGDLYALRNWIQPFLPKNYPELSWDEKVEWHARNHVPGLIHWAQEWLTTAQTDKRFEILMIDFNEFRQNEAAAINKVLSFYEVDYRLSEDDMPDKSEVPHFRRGKNDEWRDVFTPKQQEIIWKLMPEGLRNYFSWEK